MREILFRGKDVNSNEWRIGYFYTAVQGRVAIIGNGVDGYQVKPETVGQFTGLCDKSGKKVFEHDIVKAYDPLDEISFIGVVKYFDGSFYICDTDFNSYYRWMDYEVEVVGNAWDNPELLRG